MRAIRSLSFVALAATVLVACAQGDDPSAVEKAAVANLMLPSEDDFVQQVPGFGGFFVDDRGTPTVYLVPGASRTPAERVLDGYLNARGLGPAALRVVEGRYHWQQLQRWQAQATIEALAVEGAVYVDNDESSNQIRVGISDLNAVGAVESALAAAGVPAEAVSIVETPPIYQVATLQNVVDRPVRAGVQINFPGFLCSVGFNATSNGVPSFVTASHCTNKQGGVESTPYWQPLESVDGTQIATEVADPVYVKGGAGCPRGKTCRRSDSSRAAYLNPANQALGLIAATSGANNGSLTITGSFNITSDDTNNSVAVGATVNKVGRTTGWTAGAVTQKCVNTGVQGSRVVLLCQNFVSAGVGGGDSGSDVFAITSGSSVRLEGVLWGGSGSGDLFVYSPLQNVIAELGPLTTH
jgi:hypothetical protein